MTYAPTEALLAETFGLPVLAYLCAVPEDALIRRLEGDQELTAGAEAVLAGTLAELAQYAVREAARPSSPPVAHFLAALGSYDEASGRSLGTALRMAAGGEITEPPRLLTDGDPVKLHLLSLARDQYPVLLLRSADNRPFPFISLMGHPERLELQTAVEADANLSRLFPDEDPGLGRRGFVYTSLGRGSGIQSVMFGDMVVSSVWDSTSITVGMPTIDDLWGALSQAIDVLREAAAGRAPEIRAFLVFTGAVLPDGASVDTPWGQLRPLTDSERKAAPRSLEGSIGTTDEEGKQVTVSYAGDLVLETRVPFNLLVHSPPDTSTGWRWPKWPGDGSLRECWEDIQLATLLSVERPAASLVSVRPAWWWVGDPLTGGGNTSWFDTKSAPGFTPYELTVADRTELSIWTGRIKRHRTSRIDIAVRRVISGAHTRVALADRLVDSVIAWENLFGTSEGEPRLRVSAAMAWLLGGTFEARDVLQAEIKDLYDLRSRIVHGSTVAEEALGEASGRALLLAIQALAVLFRDCPEVLAMADGAARSRHLVLGGAEQTP